MDIEAAFDPNLVCRLCIADLLQYKECYSIDEEMESLIFSLTTISFQAIEERSNLMICINCYDNLKTFHEYKKSCIENQETFKNLPLKIENDQEVEALMEEELEEEDIIEYITDHEEIEEDDLFLDSLETEVLDYESNDSEVVFAVEHIIEDKKAKKPAKKINSDKPKKSDTSLHRDKGKQLYQKLLQECSVCMKMVEKNRMEGHINKHNEIRPYSCPECQKEFYCRQLLRIHRKSIHTNTRIACEVCQKTFPSTRALYSHNLRHRNVDRYECELCEKKFNNSNSLKRHSAVHSGVRDFICGLCGLGFYRKFNLDTHVKNVHDEIKNFACMFNGCRKKFGYARLLRDHMRKHHPKDESETASSLLN